MEVEDKNIEDLIQDIVKGKYGKPGELRKNLGEDKYNKLAEIYIKKFENNTIEEIADDVIKGKYGNGTDRMKELGIMFNIVQNRVNEITGNSQIYEINEKHIEILANRVIEGEFDDGMERKKNLEKMRADYRKVQNEVNKIKGSDKKYDLNLYIDEYIKKLYIKEITDDKVKKDVGEQLYNFIKNKVNEMNKDNSRNIINKEGIEQLAEKTIMLEFSEDEERKEKLGELYPFVQNRVNELLGSNVRHDTSKKPWYLNLD